MYWFVTSRVTKLFRQLIVFSNMWQQKQLKPALVLLYKIPYSNTYYQFCIDSFFQKLKVGSRMKKDISVYNNRKTSPIVVEKRFLNKVYFKFLKTILSTDQIWRFFFFLQFFCASSGTNDDVVYLKEATIYELSAKNGVFKFVPLDAKSIFIAVFVGASFPSNCGSSSQHRFLITLMSRWCNYNALHFSGSKSRRKARSALAAELFSSVNLYAYTSTMRSTINNIFNCKYQLKVSTESKGL